MMTVSLPFFSLAIAGLLLVAIYAPTTIYITPDPILPVLFYCFVRYREAMPVFAVFALGLIKDAITGMPFGFWAIIYLVLQYVIDRHHDRLAVQKFTGLWGYFTACCLLIGILMIAISLITDAFSIYTTLRQLAGQLCTILLFPLFYFMLKRLQKWAETTPSPPKRPRRRRSPSP